MKWFVFALGIVLALGGLAAISQGYEIVDVERGWTLVIAGTTALGAGVVTIALGAVVSRIEALLAVSGRPVLAEEDFGFAAEEEDGFPPEPAVGERAGVVPARAPLGDAGDEVAESPAAAEPVPAKAGRTASASPGPEAAARRPPKEPSFSFKPRDFRSWRSRAADEAMAAGPAPAAAGPPPPPPAAGDFRARPRASFVPPPAKTIPPSGLWPVEPAAAATEPRSLESLSLDPVEARLVESARFHSTRAEVPLPAENSEYDWLELALAGSDRTEDAKPDPVAPDAPGASEVSQPKPAPEPPPAPVAEHEAPAHDAQDRPVEPSVASTPEPEPVGPTHRESTPEPAQFAGPEEEPAGAAIVGRYESNGASYILFEDGTIEATMASGSYRFASMAELKDFIEGKV